MALTVVALGIRIHDVSKGEAIDLYMTYGWSIGRLARSYRLSHLGMRKKLVRWGVPLRTRAGQIQLDADEARKNTIRVTGTTRSPD